MTPGARIPSKASRAIFARTRAAGRMRGLLDLLLPFIMGFSALAFLWAFAFLVSALRDG